MSDKVFPELAKRVDAAMVKKVQVVYRFDLTADGKEKSWLVDLKNGAGAVKECDKDTKADCILIMKDADFVALMTGKLQAQAAFMKGQLKIKGM
jgi:putative sterol carrier protein